MAYSMMYLGFCQVKIAGQVLFWHGGKSAYAGRGGRCGNTRAVRPHLEQLS